MASSSRACMVSPDSWLGKKMKITEVRFDMLISCGPTAESDTLLPPPFPLASDQDLALNVNTRELHSTKRSLVFPRYFKEWNDLVNKIKGTYSTAWERMGIAGLLYLSVHEITMVATVLEGALNFWSSHCNSLILPLGPMSITLRDVVAITGLPIFGDEVPSRVTCDAFPNVTGKGSRNYAAMVTNLANKELFTVDDHLVFVWILLSQWVFEPVGCSPTLEVLVIAKALVTGQKLALGTMLLANTYHRLSIVVTNQPFSKLKGGLWLLQLWLFAYFPHLSTGNYRPESQFLGIDMCYRSYNLSLKEVLRYFQTRIPSSLNALLICSTRSDSYLPPCARTFSHAASKEDRQWWKMFCLTRKLHHGTSRARSSRISTTGMVLYATCLWARQFGLFQGIPGPLPFPSSQERHGADEDDITAALNEAETGVERSNGIIFLHPDCPSFDSWWSIVFNSCMPPTGKLLDS
ncbi:uncharacterized protein [Euphorbia lathyris]|uniref:uncharacterized protein isoform X1 n=1 Tax=Euphorbia lathyris TaxID=212925 RepID=UPI00331421DD